ncbi:ABC transporter permease subunit [bacterium]|nr:ABC transporter permease subunit [bacterium]
MKMILIIAKREFQSYFLSPIAYVYLITFLVVANWLFFRSFFVIGQVELRAFFGLMPWIFLFFVPAVSMSKWSEEKKMGTLEILLTLPVTDHVVVLGKFLASLSLIITSVLLTLTVPISIAFFGGLDWGPVIGGYIGLIFLGGAYLSLGLFVSSLTENQIIAFILGVVACFILFIIGQPFVTSGLPNGLVVIFQGLSLGTHFESVGRGVIDSRDIIYYISFIFFFLFLNYKAIEARSWK